MILGFTGSRTGTTEAQRITLDRLIREHVRNGPLVAHHGDCIGADAYFDSAARAAGCEMHVHGALVGPYLKAKCYREGDIRYPAKPPLDRNRDIVAACDLLIGCPKEDRSPHGPSGSWFTIRLAAKLGKPFTIISPDGSQRNTI